MKLKATILTTALVFAGISSLSAQPWDGKYQRSAPPSGSASRAQHSCCEVQTRQALPSYRNGNVTKREIGCTDSCKAPRAGKNCASADCRKCS